MDTVAGIFQGRQDAERAAARLESFGIGRDKITLLSPGASPAEIDAVPTDEGEQPGMGKAIGAVVGGAVGAATGLPLGAAAMVMVPGIGPILAAGVLAAALFGAGGAAVGGALEDAMTMGVPRDEVFLYEDALRQGRSVLVVLADDEARAQTARRVLEDSGAESIDAARERWWVGVREVERAHYAGEGRDWARDEDAYRRGFEAALARDARGRDFDAAMADLRARYPDLAGGPAFRRGYERGQAYYRDLTADPGARRKTA